MASGADLNADDEIAQVRARLRALETEQIALRTRLEELERLPSLFEGRASSASNTPTTSAVTSASSSAVKVTLFRRLFVGRADVFPIRWENRKTGKGGYAPACANEWVKGVCNNHDARSIRSLGASLARRPIRFGAGLRRGTLHPARRKRRPDGYARGLRGGDWED